MKKQLTRIILAVLLIMSIAVMASCGDDKEPPEYEIETPDTTEAPEETDVPDDSNTVQVGGEPMEYYTRGLNFASNGDGTCKLTGIGSAVDTYIIIPEKADNGDVVVAIGERAFEGASKISAVQIPASVTEIGVRAFEGCSALAYISIEQGNTSYIDMGGILYTVDGATLVRLPPAAVYKTLTLTKQVKRIADGASEGCDKLEKVMYEGSSDEWKLVAIGEGNDNLKNATRVYMTQSGK